MASISAFWVMLPKERIAILLLLVTAPVIDTLTGDVAVATPTSIKLVVPKDESNPANVKAVVALAGK